MKNNITVNYLDNATKAKVKKEICFKDIFGTEDISKGSGKHRVILATAIFEKNGKPIERKAIFRAGLSSYLMHYFMIAYAGVLWIKFGEKFEIRFVIYCMPDLDNTSNWNIDDEEELVNYYRENLNIFEYQRNFADVFASIVSYSDYWDKIQYYWDKVQYCSKNDIKIKIDKSYFKRQSNELHTITVYYYSGNYGCSITTTVQDCRAIEMLIKYSGNYGCNIIIDNYKFEINLEDVGSTAIGQGQNLLTVLILIMFMANGASWLE